MSAPAMQPPAGSGDRAAVDELAAGIVHPSPRVRLDEGGMLDDFCAKDVKLVHFEAMDEADWWLSVEMADGQVWHLNFGARNPRAKGYARAERVQ